MKITKKTLENMIREALEDRFNNESASDDMRAQAGGQTIPAGVQTVMRMPRTQDALTKLNAELEGSDLSDQIQANVYAMILRSLGMDTPEELEAMRTRLKSTLGRASKKDSAEGEEEVAPAAEPMDIPSAEDIDPAALAENNDFTSILKKMVQQELKAINRK